MLADIVVLSALAQAADIEGKEEIEKYYNPSTKLTSFIQVNK